MKMSTFSPTLFSFFKTQRFACSKVSRGSVCFSFALRSLNVDALFAFTTSKKKLQWMGTARKKRAKLGHVHPHMLRHSCGYYLANKGMDFLGHRDPKHTARYTRVAGHRFKGLWD